MYVLRTYALARALRCTLVPQWLERARAGTTLANAACLVPAASRPWLGIWVRVCARFFVGMRALMRPLAMFHDGGAPRLHMHVIPRRTYAFACVLGLPFGF